MLLSFFVLKSSAFSASTKFIDTKPPFLSFSGISCSRCLYICFVLSDRSSVCILKKSLLNLIISEWDLQFVDRIISSYS